MDSKNTISESNPKPDARSESDQQSSHSKPEVAPTAAHPQLPPSHPYCEITYKTEKHWWDKIKPFVEIFGIVLLAVYTAYTIKMYWANQKSADAAHDAAETASDALVWNRQQFRIEERPYITTEPYGAWFVGEKKSSFFKQKNGDILVSVAVNMSNVGRTPAVNVICLRTQFITGTPEDASNRAKNYVPQYSETALGTFLSPNNPAIIPTAPNFTMNKKLWEQFTHGDFSIYVVGGIRYKDIFAIALDKPYETIYCSVMLPPPSMAIANCNFTNSIK